VLDVKKFCHAREQLTQLFSVSAMARVQELCNTRADNVEATLEMEGDLDYQGLLVLKGRVTASLPLICQRCMKPVQYRISSKFLVSPVADEAQAKMLPRDYEPLFLTHDELDLARLVEDEIILSIPVTPMHDINACEVKEQHWSFGEEGAQSRGPNQFSELEKLNTKKRR